MIAEKAEVFAEKWIDDWNRADLEAILSHYAEDVIFSSPYVAKVLAKEIVIGKGHLREYWSAGLKKSKILHTFKEVIVDPHASSVVIIYTASINERRREACEIMRFNLDGLISSSEAYYGASKS